MQKLRLCVSPRIINMISICVTSHDLWRRGSVIASWLLDLTAATLAKDPAFDQFEGRVSDSGEGRWTIEAAIDEGVPVPVSPLRCFSVSHHAPTQTTRTKILSVMRYAFGGHLEKTAAAK
jgi:6-phosphogluconate dehydrogenase